MMGHNICFKDVIWKTIPNYPFYPFLSGALKAHIIYLTNVVCINCKTTDNVVFLPFSVYFFFLFKHIKLIKTDILAGLNRYCIGKEYSIVGNSETILYTFIIYASIRFS